MARSPNCTGAPLYKGRVDVSISYPDPDETLLETPVALPTSEPASPQIEITITSAMLPTWSPFELPHVKTVFLYAGGKNNTGGNISLNYRLLKNDASLATGSQTAQANKKWTLNALLSVPIIGGVSVGDVFKFRMWAASSGLDWDYESLVVVPARIGPRGVVVSDVVMDYQNVPVLSKGNPQSVAYTNPLLYSNDKVFSNAMLSLPIALSGTIYGLCSVTHDAVGAISAYCDATYKPQYVGRKPPSRISYTPLNLRV